MPDFEVFRYSVQNVGMYPTLPSPELSFIGLKVEKTKQQQYKKKNKKKNRISYLAQNMGYLT